MKKSLIRLAASVVLSVALVAAISASASFSRQARASRAISCSGGTGSNKYCMASTR